MCAGERGMHIDGADVEAIIGIHGSFSDAGLFLCPYA
jgi:hypothetical protein